MKVTDFVWLIDFLTRPMVFIVFQEREAEEAKRHAEQDRRTDELLRRMSEAKSREEEAKAKVVISHPKS